MSKIVINTKYYFNHFDLIANEAIRKEKIEVVLQNNAYAHCLKKIEKYFSSILILAESTFYTYSHTFHILIKQLDYIPTVSINSHLHLKINIKMYRNKICIKDIEVANYRLFDNIFNMTGVLKHDIKTDALSSYLFYKQEVFKNVNKEIKNLCEKLSIRVLSFHLCNSLALLSKEIKS